eukprot:738417-Rhodomonas_salina.3
MQQWTGDTRNGLFPDPFSPFTFYRLLRAPRLQKGRVTQLQVAAASCPHRYQSKVKTYPPTVKNFGASSKPPAWQSPNYEE